MSGNNWRSGADALSAMCRHWVNPDVPAGAEVHLQSRLMGFLFAMPFLSVLHLSLNLPAGTGPELIVPMLALAFAMPVIAAATLSISGSVKIRNLVISLAGTIGFLSVSGGRIGLAPVFYLAMAICASEAYRSVESRKAWTLSCILLATSSAVLSWSAPFGAAIAAGFAGLAPTALAAAVYALSCKQAKAGKPASPAVSFEEAEDLLVETGALLLLVRRNGFVEKAGGNADALLACSEVELAGRGLAERIHLSDKVAFLTWLDKPAAKTVECRLKSGRFDAYGNPVWLCVKANAMAAEDGILLVLLPSPEAEISTNASSGSAVGNALAVVSHELRTPLNAIVGFSDMLKQEMFGPLGNDRQREYVELVHESGMHLLGVVNGMLDWTRLENGSMQLAAEPFAPTEAAAFAVGIVSSAAMKKKISLDFQPLAAFEEFSGDQRACRQILINLLSNAVKFTPDGGLVRLTVDVVAGQLFMTVEDTGIGMTRDQQGRAGTPFYQADNGYSRNNEGAGLGLALVKQLARLHGGSVELASEPGQGTKVVVALSAIAAKAPNVTHLHRPLDDESVRIIRVFEERDNGTQRKTA